MRMYLDDTSDGVGNYVLLATNIDINGGRRRALVPSTDIWTVGRGWFNGVADFFDGQIDEVRITDGVLDPSEFLFAVDQPAVDADFDNDQDVDGADFADLAAQSRHGRRQRRATPMATARSTAPT